ncbi:DUF5818 domain-containing protein [Croceicoccus hydrothermalis]|uniref:DUF5818 domain-containing protein n=1 Tax=Croceicoccus hydrothermalis TaxID=2867964 RepID=UPI001EFA7F5E|nr:DUF5818 domain-containing protein [Croceicoccus hydrothermalis]
MTVVSKYCIVSVCALSLVACGGEGAGHGNLAGLDGDDTVVVSEPQDDARRAAADARAADSLRQFEGRLAQGTACAVLRTPGGETYALNLGEGNFTPGDYVRITGSLADTSLCMEGAGTIAIDSIERRDPPARDRGPARAGGAAISARHVLGSWVAKGANADCAKPDFDVTRAGAGRTIIETRIDGLPETGMVAMGDDPAFEWEDGIARMPIESRGPDGLAVLPGDGPVVTLAGHRIGGDGVVFVKCG